MQIKVYGRENCKKCDKLKEKITDLVKEHNISDVSIEKVNSIEKLVEKGVMTTPAVGKNGEILITGFPRTEEIMEKLF